MNDLDSQLEHYDFLINRSISDVDKHHLDIAEKCSFTDVCRAVLRKTDANNIKELISEFSIVHDRDGGEAAFDLLARNIFDAVCEKLGHRYAIMAVLIGFEDTVKIIETLDKIYEYQVASDVLLTDNGN